MITVRKIAAMRPADAARLYISLTNEEITRLVTEMEALSPGYAKASLAKLITPTAPAWTFNNDSLAWLDAHIGLMMDATQRTHHRTVLEKLAK